MSLPRVLPTAGLLAVLALSAGCQSTIGSYLSNRARDFGECFLIQGGLSLGLGVDVKAGGVAHASVGWLFHTKAGTVGWVYGEPRPDVESLGSPPHFDTEGDVGLPMAPFIGAAHVDYMDHGCFMVLPALFSLQNLQGRGEGEQYLVWLWGSEASTDEIAVWNQVHAFDVQLGATLLFLGARAGFSPGEFLDFLLGWFGVDIAGDDVGPMESAEALVERVETAGEEGK